MTGIVCLYAGPADMCWSCGGWTRAGGGPFEGDSRYCSEECYADYQERARLRDLKMACCPECGFDCQEHSETCSRPDQQQEVPAPS